MTKQQPTALTMAKSIKSPSLTPLEKPDSLVADALAAMSEKLPELAVELQSSIQRCFEWESGSGE